MVVRAALFIICFISLLCLYYHDVNPLIICSYPHMTPKNNHKKGLPIWQPMITQKINLFERVI
jgi:hypothetical protein